jgi:GH15 family glucan-1,4-alpha-glucosidase
MVAVRDGQATGMVHPIDAHALLSDTHTTALVAPDGGVDWFCTPRADGPSVFARLLDDDVGGTWSLGVQGGVVIDQSYLPATFVLRTRWSAPHGQAEVLDLLAVGPPGGDDDELDARHVLVRLVRCTAGQVGLTTTVDVRPDYARATPRWRHDDRGWSESQAGLQLRGDVPLELEEGRLLGSRQLSVGQQAAMLLAYAEDAPDGGTAEDAETLVEDTVRSWRAWDTPSVEVGPAPELVRRSALVLRALAFDETGALLAAPTTSLPEEIGGGRNWDYRFTWYRDAGLHVLALFQLGHARLGQRYLRFLLDRGLLDADPLRPMVGLRGERDVEEVELDHLAGYAGSRPVRIGNEAFGQLQVDTYGHVLDAVYTAWLLTGDLREDDWRTVRKVVDGCARRWQEPDAGLWEMRGKPRHHVNSKVMAWVCLDRGVRLAEARNDSEAQVERWRRQRDAVHAEVLARGYDEQQGAFVMSYGSSELDASLLRMPLVGFLPGDDPRVVSTLDRISERLGVGTALVHRYAADEVDDGVEGGEGAFLLSSFELVTALTHAGRTQEARRRFDWLAEHVGPLGLCPEEMTPDGAALGNYPQAFTHLGLIEAALALEHAADPEVLRLWAQRRELPPAHRRRRLA